MCQKLNDSALGVNPHDRKDLTMSAFVISRLGTLACAWHRGLSCTASDECGLFRQRSFQVDGNLKRPLVAVGSPGTQRDLAIRLPSLSSRILRAFKQFNLMVSLDLASTLASVVGQLPLKTG
ncbi:MAG: hypothetical protein LRY53_07085 [Burkholderiaceae bacterium]|nr:hypothetical protein [Burkholderiaceae bacterium]MCD8565393.1 hypothetical protein [Burkholderiaceae bacterium]